MKRISYLLFLPLFAHASYAESNNPNIVLIMVDDMGYSDIGCYGGEIPTPNIDNLANEGIRFTQFYNTSRCCPTRASLLTGLYQHQVGVGHMTTEGSYNFDYGTDGYRGQLNRNCVTLPEVLKEAGYNTYMTGKWHLGSDMDDRPLQRGFDKYYGCLRGAFNYFRPGDKYMYGNDLLEQPDPKTYYTTDAFTDTAVSWIDTRDNTQPFFLYMAYNAPHWPLHAKKEDVDKFIGKYMEGWDVLRQKRFERQVAMGLFDESLGLSPRDTNVRPWSEVSEEQKIRSDLRMAVYAAQIYSIDENVGKIVRMLKQKGELNNTLIVFLSDNGASAEPYKEFGGGNFEDLNKADKGGIISIGRGWANLCNTPFQKYKNNAFEGGMATPFIACWPNGISKGIKGKFVSDVSHIMDVMPTILELSGATYPTMRNNELINDYVGISFVPLLKEHKREEHKYLFFEHENRCAVRSGDWKIISKYGEFNWLLYNIKEDRNEQKNIASTHPEIVAELSEAWRKWALEKKVVPKGDPIGKGYH
ncbi:MAG: arylsulfatase [Salinivirgaceae bacterium]|jgi:arylsulfatase A-like enzyme|nr:arylsulfatase [Salinivirgaceae bacterium]